MLNAVNINLVAFWRYGNIASMAGQVFAIIVFAVAAAEVAVGLSLIIPSIAAAIPLLRMNST